MSMTSIAAAMALAALAQAQPAAETPMPTAGAQDATAAPATTAVVAYPPSFFADSSPSTAYDMVQRIPGFTYEAGATVRGLAGGGGNVFIDGQPPVAKNDTLEEILKRIPATAVARVDLIRGGAPGIDMQGKTVVANVVRKAGSGLTGSAMLTWHAIYDGRTLGGLRADSQWRFAGGQLWETGWVYGYGPNDTLGDGVRKRVAGTDGPVTILSMVDADSHGLRRWVTSAFETPLQGGRLRLNGAYMDTGSFVELTDRLRTPAGREYQYDTQDRLQVELGGRYTKALPFDIGLEAVALNQSNDLVVRSRFESAAVDRNFFLDKRVKETVGRIDLRRRQTATLTLETGGETALNTLESRTTLTQNGAAVRLPAANVNVEESRSELFAGAIWRATPKLTLEAKVRQEFSTVTSSGDVTVDKSLQFTKPRLALTWSPTPTRQVRARLEYWVSQLNFDDLVASSSVVNTGTVIAGNPNIEPAKAWVYEVAFEQRFWDAGALVLLLKRLEFEDVVDRVPVYRNGVAVADAPGNLGEGVRERAELSLTLPLDRLGIPSAQLKGQLDLQRTEVVDPLTGRAREFTDAAPVDWEAHYTQDLPQWNATWGADVFGQYRERYFRFGEVETFKYEPFITVWGEYKPRADLVWRLEVQNLTDRRVTRIREVYAGARGSSPVAYTDVRDLEWGRSVFLRLRKTF